MPPKQRFSPEDVIEAAFQVVRKKGWDGFSARTIAKELNSSTRPIYDHFESMENIEAAVVKKALTCFVDFISRERTGDPWLDQALGYVLFAGKEKNLFKCINDEEHTAYQRQFARRHWAELGKKLSEDERFSDMPDKYTEKIRTARWIFVHGLASLISNGWFQIPTSLNTVLRKDLDLDLVTFLEKANHGLYEEFKKE